MSGQRASRRALCTADLDPDPRFCNEVKLSIACNVASGAAVCVMRPARPPQAVPQPVKHRRAPLGRCVGLRHEAPACGGCMPGGAGSVAVGLLRSAGEARDKLHTHAPPLGSARQLASALLCGHAVACLRCCAGCSER